MPGQARRVGAYAKLLANYAYDDALIAAGEKAELLFVRGLAFCATSDSDGFITDAQVVRYVGAGMKDATKRAQTLVKEGVWLRADGGYQVRSWTKIHETAEQKGRRLKADRERKRQESLPFSEENPTGFHPESPPESEPTPDGFQTPPPPDSLSMTRQEHDRDTTQHDTTEHSDGSSRGDRPETLRAVDATKPPDNGEICTRHPDGNPRDDPCQGCKRVEERKTRRLERENEQRRRDAEARARSCDRCDGVWVLDDDQRPTNHKCDHRRSA